MWGVEGRRQFVGIFAMPSKSMNSTFCGPVCVDAKHDLFPTLPLILMWPMSHSEFNA